MKKRIDGKDVTRYIFAYYSVVLKHAICVEVEGFTKDHAYGRLCVRYPNLEWEFIEELEEGQFIGKLGDRLPLEPYGLH